MMKMQELRKICQPKDPGRPWSWSEHINRSISIYFTALLLRTGITANQTSVLSMLVGLLACGLLATAHLPLAMVGAVLFIVWDNLDCSDGEIARYRGTSSLTGLYVDRVTGMVPGALQFVAVGFFVYHLTGDMGALVLGIFAGVSRPWATLTSQAMQVSALEALLYGYRENKSVKELYKQVMAEGEIVGGFVPDLDYVGSNQPSTLHKLAWFFYKGIGRHFLLIACVFADLISLESGYRGSLFHVYTGQLVFVYGVLSPAACVAMSYLVVRRRSTEAMYQKLLDAALRVHSARPKGNSA